jgi:hypothetical protein
VDKSERTLQERSKKEEDAMRREMMVESERGRHETLSVLARSLFWIDRIRTRVVFD